MIAEVMADVLELSRAALSFTPARVLLVPGGEVVWDECCDGQLWVRLVSVIPMAERGCVVGWQLSLAVGVIRCVTSLTNEGRIPSTEVLSADAIGIVQDAEELQKVLLCGVTSVRNVMKSVITGWAPLGPNGGCAGGEWSLIVSIPFCGCE